MEYEAEKNRLVVGLGNPGRRYVRTRHNVGWMVLEALRARLAVDSGRLAFGGQLYNVRPGVTDGTPLRVALFEPHTYMNRSGEAVKGLIAFYKINCRDILVVLDDMALLPGMLRVRASGSGGGHNGLMDVLRLLGTEEVPRLRVGIGPSPPEMDPADYVLGPFAPGEMELIAPAVQLAADAVQDWINSDIKNVMEKYNRKTET